MIDKKYLPSKKFQTTLYIAISIILLAVVFNFVKSSITKYSNNNLAINASSSSSIINIDTDKDGLVDWKEGLYGTDPKKVDTDDDGTSDFDEINQDRDPLKANTASAGQEPNDKIDPQIVEQNKQALKEYEQLNEIDRFSRNLVSNVIASQPSSGSIDQYTANSIIVKALSDLPQKNYVGITKMSDLTLLKTDDTNLIKNLTDYRKGYFTETQKLVPILGTDINIINIYISNGSANAKAEMYKITDKYQAIVNSLIKIPVPVAIGHYDVNYHLAIINNLEMLIAIDKDIVNSDKDSLSIITNLSAYQNISKDLTTTLGDIDTILKVNR